MILQFVPIINKYTINTSYGQYYVIQAIKSFQKLIYPVYSKGDDANNVQY